ncbi:MAG: amidohydrolase family protein [Spirochaetaceae bacterium]|nr:amidohydrolase family protein [Spirochaetaceae bacterium]
MNLNEFYDEARLISDDPASRITPENLALLNSLETSVDCHAHLINRQSAASGYLYRKLGKVEPAESRFDDFLEFLIDRNVDNQFDQIINILKKDHLSEVWQVYKDGYSLDGPSLITALMMDLQFGLRSKPALDFHLQVDELNGLAMDNPILPFLALDPRRTELSGEDNLYSSFLRAFKPGSFFTGVKCYPAMGYLPSDPRLLPLLEICQEKNIPVTTHCGGTKVSGLGPFMLLKGEAYVRAWRLFPWGRDYKIWKNHPIGRGRKTKANFLNHPRQWLPVLKMFPKLKLNIGHLGGNDAWWTFVHTQKSQRLEAIVEMMEQYPGVYGDISGIPLEPELLEGFLENEKWPILRERALYGTDFWVNILSGRLAESIEYYKGIPQDIQRSLNNENPREFLLGTLP